MAQTITIKQSSSTNAPTTLVNGELAYSSSSNKLWIGRPGGTTSNVDAIGGKYFTDRSIETNGLSFDTATGVLTINQVGTNLSETVDLDGRYIRDKATTTALGGIKIYSGTVQSVSAQPAGTTALRTYGIQLNSLDQAVVNVPWTDVSGNNKLPLAGGTMTGDIIYGDNVKAKFGNSNDLQIYHDGSASYISEVGTGNLKIMGSNLEMKSTSDEMYLDATQDGTLRLYCDNQIRLTTTGTGVTVSGDLKINNTTLENGLETGHIYAPEVLVIDPASHSANTGKVVIDGDLEVKGVTTTIDSTTVTIADNYIQLNSAQDPTTAPPSSMFCGIQVDRGSETYDSGIYWIESSAEWVVNTGSAGINRLIHDSNFEAKYPTLDGGTF